MDISNMSKTLREVISDRLHELGRNPFEAARAAGLERSYINDILIEKKTSVRTDKYLQLAQALDWGLSDLQAALGHDDNRRDIGHRIRVMGRIGAGQEILPEFEQIGSDGLYEVQVMIELPTDAIAFEVVGESMWPRYDPGDIIICYNRSLDPHAVIGWEAAVRTAEGRRYVKRVLAGDSPETYTLESHNAQPIRNVRLLWIVPVEHVVRVGRWTKLGASDRSAQVRKVMSKPQR